MTQYAPFVLWAVIAVVIAVLMTHVVGLLQRRQRVRVFRRVLTENGVRQAPGEPLWDALQRARSVRAQPAHVSRVS